MSKTKSDYLGDEICRQIEEEFWENGSARDFWEFKAKSIYRAVHELVSAANQNEKQAERFVTAAGLPPTAD